MENIKERVTAFLAPHFPHYELKDNDDIFTLGFINSLFAMQMITFIEKEFAIVIENEDLNIEHFKSINAIVNFINRKQATSTNA